MITVLLLGAGAGIGLWLLTFWVAPPRPALGKVLDRLAVTPVRPRPPIGEDPVGWSARVGRRAVPVLRSWGLPREQIRRDLFLLGRSPDTHLAQQATLGVLGILTPPVAGIVLTLLGSSLGPGLPVIASVGLGAVGFLLPDLNIRAEAGRRRNDFRHALSAYLDLVMVSLAGGAGIDGALSDSAMVSDTWAFTHLRHALHTAQLTRTTPWDALTQLGTDLDITELTELAASVSLAGTEGARIRVSLAAKAQSLRTHLLTDSEAAAHSATEKMSLPWVLLFLGFLIFIGYPAVHQILTSL